METLSLQDLPPAGGPNHVQPAPPPAPASVAQLPPQVTSSPARADDDAETLTAFQMFTTAAQLLDLTDSESYRVMLALERPRTNIAEASATLPANDNFSSASAEKLLLVLRDGRKLIGVLRSWDQFGARVPRRSIQHHPPLTRPHTSKSSAARYHRANLRQRPLCRYTARYFPSTWRERANVGRDCAFLPLVETCLYTPQADQMLMQRTPFRTSTKTTTSPNHTKRLHPKRFTPCRFSRRPRGKGWRRSNIPNLESWDLR